VVDAGTKRERGQEGGGDLREGSSTCWRVREVQNGLELFSRLVDIHP